MKIEGNDFMCGLTFPFGDRTQALYRRMGRNGGRYLQHRQSVASENETTRTRSFPKDRWFAIRMRVTPEKIEAWLDDKKIVDEGIVGKKISLRFRRIEPSRSRLAWRLTRRLRHSAPSNCVGSA